MKTALNKTAGIEDSYYNDANNEVGGDFEDLEAVLASCTTSAKVESFIRATLNSKNLKSLTVKDLPERIKEKMLSLLRSQTENLLKKRRSPAADDSGESHADKELCRKEISCVKLNASSTVLVKRNSVFWSARAYSKNKRGMRGDDEKCVLALAACRRIRSLLTHQRNS